MIGIELINVRKIEHENTDFLLRKGCNCQSCQTLVVRYNLQNSSLKGFYGKTAPLWAHWGALICDIYQFLAKKSRNRGGCT